MMLVIITIVIITINSFPADGENSIQEETGSPRRYVQLSHRKGLFEVRSINLTHKEMIQ